MSYSRWINSYWYTYWTTDSGKVKNTQRFEICSCMTFTYKELKEDIYECLSKVMSFEFGRGQAIEDIQMRELKVYMEEFLKDVEYEYVKCTIEEE